MRKAGPLLAIASTALALCACCAESAVAAPFRGPDRPVATAPAKPGSAYAAKSALNAKQLRHDLAQQVHATGGVKGVKVIDLDARRHRTLYSSSPGRSMLLASNTKLFTTGAFLEQYGPGKRFATRVWARGHRTGASNGRLKGSLVLVGSGDPALAAGSFAHDHNLPLTRVGPLAKAIKRAGVRRLDGNIKADPSVFDAQRMPRETGITPEGELGTISGLEYDSGFSNGTPSASPATDAGDALRAALEAQGVKVKGKVEVGRTPASLRKTKPIASVKSPPTSSLISEVNTPSNDMWAEILAKRLGASGARPGSTARGVKRIERFAKSFGAHVSLENGSGLSRVDRSTPNDVVALLRHMNQHRFASTFRPSLALACRSGTVVHEMCGTAAAGNCRTKTGTLRDVSALSGYCQAGRHRLAFSILLNEVTDFDAAHHRENRMAAEIARYRP